MYLALGPHNIDSMNSRPHDNFSTTPRPAPTLPGLSEVPNPYTGPTLACPGIDDADVWHATLARQKIQRTHYMTVPRWNCAPCRRSPGMWDDVADAADVRAETEEQRTARHRTAAARCRKCPVIIACRDKAAELPHPTGVWAGELYPKVKDRAHGGLSSTTGPQPRRTKWGAGAALAEVDAAFAGIMAAIRTQDPP